MSSPASLQPYRGSCRCGFIRYVVYLSMPPVFNPDGTVDSLSGVRIYKCNCTACLKFGLFHLRLPQATQHFQLLAPLNPEKDLTAYKILEAGTSWYFCPTCGVRCYSFKGKGKVEEVEVEEWVTQAPDRSDMKGAAAAGGDGSKKVKTKAWMIDGDGWDEHKKAGYLSVNLQTLEPEDGLDLRELVDNKWMAFLDCREYNEKPRYDQPCAGGTW